MVIDAVREDININDVLNYIKSCDLISVREGKNTKSVYFKDNDNNYTVFIYSLLNNSATVLATIAGINFNTNITRQIFYNIFDKYKIFK
jgi:exonuclease I